MRKLLIGLGVLVVILVAGAFVGPLFVPADSIKQDIAREVAKATGRDLAIDGDLKFRVLPAPGVSVSGIRLSNAKGGSAADMLKLGAATVEVALFPLITGNIQISRIVLSSPDILLEQYADGTNNWTFTPEVPAEAGQAAGTDTSGGAQSDTPPIRLDDVMIKSGTLVFRTPDQTERIENINASLGAGSLQGPFRAEGSLNARGFAIDLNTAIGELAEDKATPVNLRISTGGAEIGYSGVLAGAPDAARLSGQIEVRAGDLSALIATLTDGPAPAALRGKSLEIDGTLAASEAAVSINDLALRLGEDSATGAVDVTLGEAMAANVVLNLPQLDLDRLLAATPSGTATTPASSSGSDGGNTPSGGATEKLPAESGFAIPTGISATLETKIDAVVYRGGIIRQVLLNTQLEDGTVNVSQAAAQLPGGANASVIGFVSATDAQPKFEGQAELSADDFRALLQWAGVDVASVPQDRLRKMAGTLALTATPDNVTLTDIDFSVDVSRLRGGVAIALRERPGFGVGLSLDKINLDAYMPAAAPEPAPAADTTTSGESAPAQSPAASQSTGSGLAVLDTFDAILQLKVGEVVFREQRVTGINVDGTLQGGELELRDASVASLAGAQAAVKGRINDLSAAPMADVEVSLDAKNGDRLLALAGVDAPVKVGAAKLNGSLRGDMQDLAVDVTLDALGARLKTAGTLGALALPPRYDVKLDLNHPNAAAFLARVQGEAAPSGKNPGALAVSATARGDLSATELDAQVEVGPGTVEASGNLANLTLGSPTGTMAINASHPDMVSFARVFAPDYKPGRNDLGPFALTTNLTLSETSMDMTGLDGRAGPVSFRGKANVATAGVRPNIVAELTTSEIVVDDFLPAQSGSGSASSRGGTARSPAPATSAGERWSREPIDVSGLRAADADIKLSSPAITYTDIRVDNPRVAVTLNDGVLDLTQLSGNAFGGGFNMTAQLAAREVPTMRYKMTVDGADAAKFLGGGAAGASGDRGVMSVLDILFPVSDVTLASGTLGADLDITSRGRSQFEMISNLAGKGAMRFTDAVVDGINVCEISDQLERLNGVEGFLGLAGSGRGGQTKVANFNGRFDMANGVATLPQQQINAECAAVAFTGTTSLPAWLVNIQARAGFPAHPEFPGVVVEQKGPLDAPNTRLVNVNEINQFIVGKAAGSVLRKLLPGGDQQQPSSGGSSSQSEDPFKNLLEGLIRRR